jgi:hypothetical protein
MWVGLAEPERQTDHQPGADLADDIFGDGFRIGEQFCHTFLAKDGPRGGPAVHEEFKLDLRR